MMVLVTSCHGDMVGIFVGSQGICQARCLCLCVPDPTGGTQEQGPTGVLVFEGVVRWLQTLRKKVETPYRGTFAKSRWHSKNRYLIFYGFSKGYI